MKNLLLHLQQKIRVSPQLAEAVQNAFQEKNITKQTLLLSEHQYARKLYFVEQGVFRTYYHHEGKEITSWFYKEQQFLSSWSSFYRQQASFEYIEALENSTVLSVDYHQYHALINTYPQFERFARLLAEEQLSFIDAYSKGYLFMSAKEKYQLLLTYFPGIELRVKLGYLASFLGISQETLSRIRSKK